MANNVNGTQINICLRAQRIDDSKNPRIAQRIRENCNLIKKRYPKFSNIQTNDLMDALQKEIFPDGFKKEVFIRNTTYSSDKVAFAIRPKRTEGDYLSSFIEVDQTLLFSVHKFQGICYIDNITVIQNDEMQYYEAFCIINSYPRPLPEDNSVIDLVASLESLTAITAKNLTEWKGYLGWKRQIANKQIHGAKYYNFSYDNETKLITFNLIFNSKEAFDREKRYIKRDACVFNNVISLNQWDFRHDKDLFRVDSSDLGFFQGFVNEKELIGSAEENPSIVHEHPRFREAEKEIKETSNLNYTDSDIKELFESAYLVNARYKLPDEILKDLVDDDFLDNEEQKDNKEIIEKYIKEIPKNGFIALSAAGEFALIRRFENAIKDLEDGNCYSQSLSNWLFDVSKARVPVNPPKEIEEWANPLIAENKNQREAVMKAINADELFLLQGPPGTGKTTVIAEIIYQLVKQGNRVLVSSQSNDAVDNALDRLSVHPQVRAIRLGKRGGKKKNKNDSNCKYIESETLKYYYHSISDSLSEKMLKPWAESDSQIVQTQKDLRNIKLIKKALDELTIEIRARENDIEELNGEYKKISESIYNQTEESKEKENLKRHSEKFVNFCKTLVPYDILPDSFLTILKKNIEIVYKDAKSNGIHIPENFLAGHKLIQKTFPQIINQLKKGGESSANSEANNLKVKINLCREEILAAVDSENEELQVEKKKELKKVKAQLDNLEAKGSQLDISLSEEYFSPDFIILCKNDKQKSVAILESCIQAWRNAVIETCKEINQNLKTSNKSELEELIAQRKMLEAKINSKKDENKNKIYERKLRNKELNEIKARYVLEQDSTEIDVEAFIKESLDSQKEMKASQDNFRNVFGDSISKFAEKLNLDETYQYDNEYFLGDYIKTCNVVGISCTNNMKDLSDKGFEYFDVVIIDEVSKATPPELLIPLMKAGKVILVGDHRQLPPMFKEHEKSYTEMIDDLGEDELDLKEVLTEENFRKYKNMITASLFKSYFEKADCSIKHSLLTQYRMHSDIMKVINRFYENRLECGNRGETEKKLKAHNLKIEGCDGSSFISPEKHVFWLDSSFLPSGTPINETYRENSTSASNVLEKYLIIELIKKIAVEYTNMGYPIIEEENGKKTETKVSIGIISFYQRQVNEIRDAVKALKKDKEYKNYFNAIDVDVNTVDRFQGKEKNIIITSLVRNNKYAKASKHVVTYERINVAFSRAQNLLFIVGATHMYQNLSITIPKMDKDGELTLPVYSTIIDELRRNACFAKSSKLISPAMEKQILEEYKAQGGK